MITVVGQNHEPLTAFNSSRALKNQWSDVGLVPSTKSTWHFSLGFQIIAENKLCAQQKFMILAHFVHRDLFET